MNNKKILTQIRQLHGKTPKTIACGDYHTMVLMTDGTLYGTGYNTNGQLGLGNNIDKNTLTQIQQPDNKTPKTIACGDYHTMVIMTDGTLYGTGLNTTGQLGLGNNIDKNTLTQIKQLDGKTPKTIACGHFHTMVIMTDGTLYGTGYNEFGQLGLGDVYNNHNTLTQIQQLDNKTPKTIACGDYYTMVLMTDGTLYGTGKNTTGQLGLGNNIDKNTLTQIQQLDNKIPKTIACGNVHTMVLMIDETLYGTGANSSLGLGNNDDDKNTLTQILQLDGKTPKTIACGDVHTMVLMTDGTLYGTGFNLSGQLGLGNNDDKNTLTQILQLDGKTPKTIACGKVHTMVLMIDETLYGTGGSYGNTLTQILQIDGKTPKTIACGGYYTMVLMTDGTLYGTGENNYGQLGLGNNINKNILIQIQQLHGKTPKIIACGKYHTMVLMTDGTLYGTGLNVYGQLGLGNNDNKEYIRCRGTHIKPFPSNIIGRRINPDSSSTFFIADNVKL